MRIYSAITGQPITEEMLAAAAASVFSGVMPHSATDMYQCCDVVFCLCCQGSLPFTWNQEVALKYCDVLPDYTASHPRTLVVLTTLDIFSVCSLYIGIPETLSCIFHCGVTVYFCTPLLQPELLGRGNILHYDYTLIKPVYTGVIMVRTGME
jgi:hypothetical protein